MFINQSIAVWPQPCECVELYQKVVTACLLRQVQGTALAHTSADASSFHAAQHMPEICCSSSD